jgi:hypothetical protein
MHLDAGPPWPIGSGEWALSCPLISRSVCQGGLSLSNLLSVFQVAPRQVAVLLEGLVAM